MSIKPERRPNWGIKYWEGVFSIKLDFSKRMTSRKPSLHKAQNTKKSLIKYTNEGLLVEKTGYLKTYVQKGQWSELLGVLDSGAPYVHLVTFSSAVVLRLASASASFTRLCYLLRS